MSLVLWRLRQELVDLLMEAAMTAWALGWRFADRQVQADLARHRFDDQDTSLPKPPAAAAPPDAWLEAYRATVDAAMRRYTDGIRRDVSDLVTRGAVEGWTQAEISRKIEKLVTGLTTWQAERIARTESMRLWNLGSFGRMSAVPEVVGYEYSVVLDSRTSHICRPLAGLKVRKEDLLHLPPLHPHCRTVCSAVYSFDGVTDQEFGNPNAPAGVPGFGAVPSVPNSVRLAGGGAAAAPAAPPPPPPPKVPPAPPSPPGGDAPLNDAWRAAVEQARLVEISERAADAGYASTQEFITEVERNLQSAIDGMQLFTRTQVENAIEILSGGRFKSLFETGQSGGANYPTGRRVLEKAMWGYGARIKHEKRPIYGYLHPEIYGGLEQPDILDHYGTVAVRFRPSLRRRATFTVGDSADRTLWAQRKELAPSRLGEAKWTSVSGYVDNWATLKGAASWFSAGSAAPMYYIEAQYHGGVGVDEIEEVMIRRWSANPDFRAKQEKIRDLAALHGIPFTVINP
jgi:SPP1 gp7 family putative phage head morphogenesis protein